MTQEHRFYAMPTGGQLDKLAGLLKEKALQT